MNADWISGLASAGALVISIIALLLQRRQHAGQLSIQERMARVEERGISMRSPPRPRHSGPARSPTSE